MRPWIFVVAGLLAGCRIEENPNFIASAEQPGSTSSVSSAQTSTRATTTGTSSTGVDTFGSSGDATSVSTTSGGSGGGELPDGAVVVLRMEDSAWSGDGTVLDTSGNNRHFTPSGDPQTVPDGAVGRAGSFDGLGDFVVDEDAEDYLSPLSALTVAVWVRADQVGTDRGILSGRVPDGGDASIVLRYDVGGMDGGAPNAIKVAVSGTADGTTQLESSANVQTTDWQHIAFVWQAGQPLELYIDGVLDVPSFVEPPSGGTINLVTTLMVGRGSKDVAATDGWIGLIDELVIWDRALSDAEIASVYAGP